MHINPDHFLETENGRVTTHAGNLVAWDRCYQALEVALRQPHPASKIYLMVGVQGSGKSTWVRSRMTELPHAVFFDAILVKRSERRTIVARARTSGVSAIAVWLRTPLDVCLARNASRPGDEVVDEQAIRRVFAALEPPSTEEGFEQVLEIP